MCIILIWTCLRTQTDVGLGVIRSLIMGKKKLTIDAMQETGAARGGKCLSDAYVNSRSKLLWDSNLPQKPSAELLQRVSPIARNGGSWSDSNLNTLRQVAKFSKRDSFCRGWPSQVLASSNRSPRSGALPGNKRSIFS
jgi:hypothetical protein